MIKQIQHYLLIFILVGASNVGLKAMEDVLTQPESIIKESSETPLKSKKKRNRRKNKKSILEAKEPSEDFKVPVKLLEDKYSKELECFVKAGDLRTVFSFNDDSISGKKLYIEKLNFWANILLLQQWIMDQVKEIEGHALKLYKTCKDLTPIYCISIREDGLGICGHSKDEQGENSTKIILSDKGIKLADSVTKYLIAESNYDLKKVKSYYNYCSDIVARYKEGCDRDEFIVAQYNKYLIENHVIASKIADFKRKAEDTTFQAAIKLNYFAHNKNYINTLIDLIKKKLPEISDQLSDYNLMADFISFCLKLETFHISFKKVKNPLTIEMSSLLYVIFGSLIKSWESKQAYYQALYAKILKEQDKVLNYDDYLIRKVTSIDEIGERFLSTKKDLLKMASRAFLHPDFIGQTLPKKIGHQSEKNILIEPQDNFLDPSVLAHNNQSQKKVKKSTKNKCRRRGHRKTQASQDKEEAKDILTIKEPASAPSKQERIKFPCYADRIIAKFNQPRNINDFYHTYSPIADAFIMKYGTVEQRTNQTFDCGMDTKYSIKGKVDCGDGEVIYGTFGVTLGAVDNICYHREFISSTEKEYEDINGTSDLESESAELVSKDDAYVSARLQFNANNDEIYGEKRFNENSKFIVIEDKRNEVTITLFKTENNNFVH